jgi:hypothetical protein
MDVLSCYTASHVFALIRCVAFWSTKADKQHMATTVMSLKLRPRKWTVMNAIHVETRITKYESSASGSTSHIAKSISLIEHRAYRHGSFGALIAHGSAQLSSAPFVWHLGETKSNFASLMVDDGGGVTGVCAATVWATRSFSCVLARSTLSPRISSACSGCASVRIWVSISESWQRVTMH